MIKVRLPLLRGCGARPWKPHDRGSPIPGIAHAGVIIETVKCRDDALGSVHGLSGRFLKLRAERRSIKGPGGQLPAGGREPWEPKHVTHR